MPSGKQSHYFFLNMDAGVPSAHQIADVCPIVFPAPEMQLQPIMSLYNGVLTVLCQKFAGRQKSKAKAKARAQSGEAKAETVAKPEPYKPLDYSKFNNIADSDEEDEGPSHHCKECERARKVRPVKFLTSYRGPSPSHVPTMLPVFVPPSLPWLLSL
jgi:hypothetical protein